MTQDPCESARQELANAEKQLQAHLENPMDWKVISEDETKHLRAEVALKKKALDDCLASK